MNPSSTESDLQSSSEKPLTAKDGMNLIAQKLKDSKVKDRLDMILSTYAKFDRMSIVDRQDDLFDEFSAIMEDIAAIALMNFLDSSGPYTKELIELVEDKEEREVVRDLAIKFNPIFVGFYNRHADSWYKMTSRKYYDLNKESPAIRLSILKTSNETVYLDMSIDGYISFMLSLIAQLDPLVREIKEPDQISIVRERVEEIQKTMNSILDNLRSVSDSRNG